MKTMQIITGDIEKPTLEVQKIRHLENGLIIPDNISDNELKHELAATLSEHKSLPWKVGDLLTFLEKRSQAEQEKKAAGKNYDNEKIGIYKSLLKDNESNRTYLVECKRVCKTFVPSERTFKLPFTSYLEAVSLTKSPAEAKELLRDAEQNEWSSRQIRKNYRLLNSPLLDLNTKPNLVAEIIKLAAELGRKLKGSFTKPERELIEKELKPVIEWYESHVL